MITEEESKNKMCPFTSKDCIASGCMAWKVVFKDVNRNEPEKSTKLEKTSSGYCTKLI
jgi:hypothetical protein